MTDPAPMTSPDDGDEAATLLIGSRTVALTKPGKALWPSTGTTKQELVEYLVGIAPVLLPHVRDRATMLWRFPEGVDGPGWFQAQCRSRPAWVRTHAIRARNGKTLDYCVVDEPATLAWLGNLGTIELHPHGWTVSRPDEPTHAVFDLDPGPPAGLREAAGVALAIRDRLQKAGFDPVVKTSGSLGLHVAAPLADGETFPAARAFVHSIAVQLATESPHEVVIGSGREVRRGRVFIDWAQNNRNRQLIAPYSPRATGRPGVSVPLSWSEVEGVATGPVPRLPTRFRGVLDRVDRYGDLWASRNPRGVALPTE